MYIKVSLSGDERLCGALIPKFPVRCRRLLLAVGYLSALTVDNLRRVNDEIVSVAPNGIEISTGEVIEIDVLVYVTGFNISFCADS